MSNETSTEVPMTTTAVECTPTNSCEGHYTCNNETGDKICDAGYKGVECKDRDFNDLNDPECPPFGECKNGGTCWNKTCCCVDGYEGVLCHVEIMECFSSPCVNGGTCRDELGSYRCECLEGKFCCEYNGMVINVIKYAPIHFRQDLGSASNGGIRNKRKWR